MAKKKYIVYSPDGIPLRERPFDKKQEALDYWMGWCAQYQDQEYYFTASGEQIPFFELPERLRIEIV